MRRRLLVTAPLIALLCLVFGAVSASAAGPAPVPDLRAQKSGTSVILTWTHSDASADHYEVWWSDSPYAAIGDAGMVKIANVTPGAPPSQATYTDTASGVGNTAVNSFYAVRSVTAGGELSALSNRAGEFDFGLPIAGLLPVVDHCGTISANQNWGPNAVHRVTCNVTVASGVKLTALAGTVVKFLPSTGFFVQGTLNAAGTKTNPIVFTSIKQDAYGGDSNSDGGASTPAIGNWYGIFFDGAGASASLLDHAIVEYGSQQLNNWHGANWSNNLVFWQAASILQNSLVRYGTWAIHVQNAATGIYTNTVTDNANSGIVVASNSYPTIRGNTLQNNGRCAIDAPVDEIPNITDNQFLGPDANDGICGRGTTIAATGTWQNQAVPYRISGSMVVGGGVTLTMQVGTQLHFLQNSSLRSDGTLESSGADAWVAYNPVTMDGEFTFRQLGVVTNGLLTHSGATTSSESRLAITAITVTVNAGSAMDVSGRGYLGGYSGGNDSDFGRTLGNTTTGGSQQYSGGSYGGLGGWYSGSYGVANVYGTFTDPHELGSGGGGYRSSYTQIGGNGGGLLHITADVLVLDGAIRANGTNGVSGGYANGAGGGSGGGIRLDIGTLTGAGSIQAIGGNGLNADYGDGGGGGGRIAIYYTNLAGFNSGNITAYGGIGRINGGAGTVFLMSTTQVNGTLVVDAQGREGANTPLSAGWIPNEFKALNKARISVVTSSFQAGAVLIAQGSILEIDGAIISDDFQVRNGSVVRHPATTTTHEAALSVQAGSLSIDASSAIDVTGRGYLGGRSGGNESDFGRTLGNTTTGGSQQYSGGSYGGLGGWYSGSYGVANVYGTFTDPHELGSGGGGYRSSYTQIGGNGGGLLHITADVLVLDGAIRANGTNGVSGGYANGAGGGSGGGIRLDIGTLTGAGSIQAIGGNGLNADYGDGGGGGGRIAIYYTNLAGFNSGNITAYGGIGRINGGAGTVFLMNRANYHTYISALSTPWTQFVAEPVNVILGNYTTQHVDLSFPTRGLPVRFERGYNSIALDDGPLGYGWTHSYNLAISRPITGFVALRNEDGRVDQYTDNGNGTYKPPTGIFDTVISNSQGYTLTRKDQTAYRFDTGGRLLSIADKNGNTTALAYDGNGRLVSVTEPAGRILNLSYNAAGRMQQLSDPLGRTVIYDYDGAGNLTAVTDPTGQTTHYAYDLNHRLTGITDANGHTFVRNIYDSQGRVTQQRDALDNLTLFDYHAGYTVVTDALSHPITYTYDSGYRITGETDSLGGALSYQYDWDNNRTQVTDKRGNVTRYTYDSRGNVLTIVDPAGTTTMTYDTTAGRNNLLTEKDRLNHTTVFQYDARSNLTRRTDALSGVTTWAYDAYGQVTSTTDANSHATTYGYDANGSRTSITEALGNTTSATYDTAGRKLTETDPLGRATTTTYDPVNRVLSISEPLGKTTVYTYDAVGNRITVTENGIRNTQYAFDAKDRLASVTDPLGHTTTYGYDAVDNQISVTDPLGHATTYTYDALNRRTAVKDALNNTTSYEYDPNGNRTKLTDATGKATTYTYDALNRLTGVTDAAGGTVTYAYDAAGNRTSLTDANSHTTTYAYDALKRLVSATDPLSHVTSYSYDAVGNRTSETRPDGTVISSTFDAANRLIEVTDHAALVTQHAYNAVGNRATLTDATGTTTYTYDDLNRLTQAAGPNGTIDYGYDLFGNRTSLIYPGAQTVTYAYDLANRLTTVTDHASRTTQYTYDAANRPAGIQYPNGVQAAYTYDNADRLLSLIHTSPVSGTIASAIYTLDAVGNRLSMQDLDGATSYAYDSLYRLTQVTYSDGEQVTYAYDPMGNRTSLVSSVSGTTAYTYDAADRLLSAGAITFTWDDNGRMTGKGSATYAYDALDRLTQVISGTTTVGYAYNGDGIRLSKTVNGATTTYVQEVQAPLPIVLTETTGGQPSLYLYGNDLLAEVSPTGNPTYYHADGLGSTRALSNCAGQRTDAYSYDVFGATRNHSGASAQPFTFAGEQGDGDLGLVFLRARYYDPGAGRFLTKDPHPGALIAPQTLNKYPYATNEPVLLQDKDGEFVIPLIVIGVVGYSAYQAWDSFLDRSQQMETNMRGYYSFDFENPEWQQKYENYNPAKDYQAALAAGVHAGVSTPGTSFSGPPPGITGSIGSASLISTIAKKLMFWLSGFKGPEPYRWDQGNVLGFSGGGGGSAGGGFGDGESDSWGGPPSKTK